MKTTIVLIAILLSMISCGAKNDKPQPAVIDNEMSLNTDTSKLVIKWELQKKELIAEGFSYPGTSVSLKINHQVISILEDAAGEYMEMDAEYRSSWEVPESALIACIGGYAGLYNVVYVEEQGDSLIIKKAWSEEMGDGEIWEGIETLRTIPIPE